jgi:hypothetical protein
MQAVQVLHLNAIELLTHVQTLMLHHLKRKLTLLLPVQMRMHTVLFVLVVYLLLNFVLSSTGTSIRSELGSGETG